MLTGASYDSSGPVSAGPIDGLISSEIEIIGSLDDMEKQGTIDRAVGSIKPEIMRRMGNVDPGIDGFKAEWLARHAIEEYGADDPVKMLNFISRLADQAKAAFPRYGTLDAAYKLSRMMRAESDIREAGSV